MGMISGKGGGNKSLASKPNLLSALRVQTSSYGQVLPIVYGQNRISGRLIWSGDFTAIPHTSTQKVCGKGMGTGGGNAVTNTTYTYQTAVAIALCLGPIQNIHNIWGSKGKLTMISSSVQFTVPGGGGLFHVIPPGAGIFHSGRGVSRGDSYSVLANDFGSDGPVSLSGTQQTPMLLVAGGTLGMGQYTQSGNSYNFSAADAGKTMTINYVYSVPDSNSNGQPLEKLSFTLFLGERPQAPWSYLTSRHPGEDLGYNGLAYMASANMDLGESATLPNLSFEVLGILPFGGATTDAEPSAIIADVINNPCYGLSGAIPLDNLRTGHSFAQFRNFCVANGIFLSPVLDAQKSAAEWIQDVLDITNSAAVWSEGVLKIVPYGDTTAVGNGATFVPNTAPIYDLTNTDFLAPVTVKRPSIADVMNSVSVEFLNRANDYNVEVAEDKDEAAIAVYGLRKAAAKQAHSITTATVAKFVANLLRKRSVEIRATYTLQLGWQFNLLEPMDLVTITVPELGYNKKPVRITAIREDDSGQLELDAEDFPFGTSTATLYPHQEATGFAPQANCDPGNVSAPIIFEANDRLSQTGNYEVWVGACPATLAVTAASNATPIQITAAGHGFKTGQTVAIAGVLGNTAANGTWKITVADSDNFTLNGSAGNGSYVSGGLAVNEDWGGCSVWVSPDNQNYAQAGRIFGASRMGKLTAQLPSAADPDVTHALSVDLTQSLGTLLSGSQSDCDNFRTLCWVDGELIAHEDATLTAAYHYDLGAHGSPVAVSAASNSSPIVITAAGHGYSNAESVVIAGVGGNTVANGTWVITVIDANNFSLNGSSGNGAYTSGGTATIAARLRRGVFGSPIATHNAGSGFLRLDNAVFVWEADPTLVGTTIYFKFTSFNTFGLMEQSLANAAPYSFVFNGIFGNNDETPANNATIDSVFVSGSVDSIRVYGPGGVASGYTAWKMKDQGGSRSLPAQTITVVDDTGSAPQVSTPYWISYDFNAGTHRAWANYNNYVQAIYRGQMRVGSLTTVSSSGTGGTTGGLGGNTTGGSGAGGRQLPGM